MTLVAPAGTTTVAGTVADAEELLSVTVVADAVALDSFTMPVTVVVEDPRTPVGPTERLVNTGAVMASTTLFLTPPSVAEIVALELAVTGFVVIVNVAVVAPYGTLTEDGSVALADEEVRGTGSPAGGALAEIVIVPFAVLPPGTETGVKAIAVSW